MRKQVVLCNNLKDYRRFLDDFKLSEKDFRPIFKLEDTFGLYKPFVLSTGNTFGGNFDHTIIKHLIFLKAIFFNVEDCNISIPEKIWEEEQIRNNKTIEIKQRDKVITFFQTNGTPWV